MDGISVCGLFDLFACSKPAASVTTTIASNDSNNRTNNMPKGQICLLDEGKCRAITSITALISTTNKLLISFSNAFVHSECVCVRLHRVRDLFRIHAKLIHTAKQRQSRAHFVMKMKMKIIINGRVH